MTDKCEYEECDNFDSTTDTNCFCHPETVIHCRERYAHQAGRKQREDEIIKMLEKNPFGPINTFKLMLKAIRKEPS